MTDGLTQHQHRGTSHLETCQKTSKLQVQNRRNLCLQETKCMRHIRQFTDPTLARFKARSIRGVHQTGFLFVIFPPPPLPQDKQNPKEQLYT